MRKIDTAKKFRSEYKRVKKQYKNISEFDEIAHYLKNEDQITEIFFYCFLTRLYSERHFFAISIFRI